MWSRFRPTQTLRDDGPLLTACAFLRGFELLVSGTASGELKLHDAYSGENVELIDAHSSPINLLQVRAGQRAWAVLCKTSHTGELPLSPQI